MGETPVMGSPAALLARHERPALFRMMGDGAASAREATALGAALWGGGMKVDRATFDFYRESAPAGPAVDESALAEAAEGLWPLWQQQPAGRAAWPADGQEMVSIWRRTAGQTAAFVISVDDLLTSATDVTRSLDARFSLEDSAGRPVWGVPPVDSAPLVRSFRETGLPWTLRVGAADPAALEDVAARRRNLLMAGLAFMVMVVVTASVFVYRALSRELAVARLQSDFVAAVSHEFRTPLTAMRHLTELLEEGDTPGDRLPRYYRALAQETRRLHGMVESLLDFGRMEAGQRTYQMEDTSAAELAKQVVDEFCEQVSVPAQRVVFDAPGDERGDPVRCI